MKVTTIQTLSKETEVTCDDGKLHEAYESQHMPVAALIDMLKDEYVYKLRNTINPEKRESFEYIVKECENWLVDDYQVLED